MAPTRLRQPYMCRKIKQISLELLKLFVLLDMCCSQEVAEPTAEPGLHNRGHTWLWLSRNFTARLTVMTWGVWIQTC